MADVNIYRHALRDLARSPETAALLEEGARRVRDRARENARAQGARANRVPAIVADDPQADAEGLFVDVGYDKSHPGFDLWWTEVGTVDQAARPHLRPALKPGLI